MCTGECTSMPLFSVPFKLKRELHNDRILIMRFLSCASVARGWPRPTWESIRQVHRRLDGPQAREAREAFEIRHLTLKLTQLCGSRCIQRRPGNSERVSVDQIGIQNSVLQIREYVTKLFAT